MTLRVDPTILSPQARKLQQERRRERFAFWLWLAGIITFAVIMIACGVGAWG